MLPHFRCHMGQLGRNARPASLAAILAEAQQKQSDNKGRKEVALHRNIQALASMIDLAAEDRRRIHFRCLWAFTPQLMIPRLCPSEAATASTLLVRSGSCRHLLGAKKVCNAPPVAGIVESVAGPGSVAHGR